MDPNAALESILRGDLIADHAEALTKWLQQGGFAPADTKVPNDPARFLLRHCDRHYPHIRRTTIRVRADKAGVWTAPPDGPWICAEIWFELCRMDGATNEARAEGERLATEFLNDHPWYKR
jgi:hypothetical protein